MSNNSLVRAIYKKRRYRSRRAAAFKFLGGERCIWCGRTEDIELDHIDRHNKKVKANYLHCVSYERFLEELKNLQPLCSRCHGFKSKAAAQGVELEMEFDFALGRDVPVKLIEAIAQDDDKSDIPF